MCFFFFGGGGGGVLGGEWGVVVVVIPKFRAGVDFLYKILFSSDS